MLGIVLQHRSGNVLQPLALLDLYGGSGQSQAQGLDAADDLVLLQNLQARQQGLLVGGGVGFVVAADHKKLRGLLLAKHAAYRLLLLLPMRISGL